MARVVVGSYMVRYPLGGMMSWVLQYLAGFHALGHEVWFVERAGWPDACFDPVRGTMTDDPSSGTRAVAELLERVGLAGRWCFVDVEGRHHGLDGDALRSVFAGADVFVDMGTHGAFAEESQASGLRVLLDGEPGLTQMKMDASPSDLPEYDAYYTTGRNIGTPRSSAPTAGRDWRPIVHPVVPELFPVRPLSRAPFTTVMNWHSHGEVRRNGVVYGQKDLSFAEFADLPARVAAEMELAVGGPEAPFDELRAHGWRVRDAHEVTATFDGFRDYLASSLGEFGLCKQAFVATRSGWFSDRSAAYLAGGRPVVLQETGFSDHLPCGEGLFAAATADEAAEAVEAIAAEPERHSAAARRIAEEHLAAERVLGGFLEELGVT